VVTVASNTVGGFADYAVVGYVRTLLTQTRRSVTVLNAFDTAGDVSFSYHNLSVTATVRARVRVFVVKESRCTRILSILVKCFVANQFVWHSCDEHVLIKRPTEI
jgi:hypothetical protein